MVGQEGTGCVVSEEAGCVVSEEAGSIIIITEI
jgi:hypothetical protein